MAFWYDENVKSNEVISTRIRLARNLKGYRFRDKLTNDEAKEILQKVENALSEMNYDFTKYDMLTISQNEKNRLVEKRYISPDFLKGDIPRCVYISEDSHISIMVNEEDHVRIQCIFAGNQTEKCYSLISKIDTYLCERLDFAIHEKYGYLTSCLTNVGTGMRLSYMVHLASIVATKSSQSIFDNLTKLGVSVRGVYGEGTKGEGNVFQISNSQTLGKSEDEIIKNMSEILKSLMKKEDEIKEVLKEKNELLLKDKVMRSYAILKNCIMISGDEMSKRISDLRYAKSLGFIDDISDYKLTKIMIEASKAHLILDNEDNPEIRDVKRAEMIKSIL